ncbi:MAG: indole-3-glycerol phosphate synthase TrpC [Kiritimatiellia bacterium]
MADILVELSAARRRDAELRARSLPEAELRARAEAMPPPPDFAAAFAGSGFRVIAELKQASPSEGLIRADFAPIALADELAAAGAAALSVLCEPHRFLGSEDFLTAVAQRVRIPVLYKDFVTTPYQVLAARAAGASAVLLIAAVLDAPRLASLLALARELRLTALVETHDRAEIARALACGARVVGVNCRDLRTFRTDPSVTAELLAEIPADRVRIAESGIRTAADLRALRAAGADGFLIGTTLMRAPRPGAALRTLTGAPADDGATEPFQPQATDSL